MLADKSSCLKMVISPLEYKFTILDPRYQILDIYYYFYFLDQPGSEWSGQSVCWRSLSLPPLRAARGLLRASLWFPSDSSGKTFPTTNITDIGIYCKLCPQFLWIFNPFFIASPLTKKLPTSAWLLSWWWMEVSLSPKPDRRTLSTWTSSPPWGSSTICSPSTNTSARTPLTTQTSGAVWPTN